MDIVITKELIEFAHSENLNLQKKIRKQYLAGFILGAVFIVECLILSVVAIDFKINLPLFAAPSGIVKPIVPQVNLEPTFDHMKGFVRRESANLLSIRFNSIDADLKTREGLFIKGKALDYFTSVYGTTNFAGGPAKESFAWRVKEDSLVVTAVAFGDVEQVGRVLIVDGRENYAFTVNLWQSSEGIGSDYPSRKLKATVVVEKVPRNESKHGLLIRHFVVKG